MTPRRLAPWALVGVAVVVVALLQGPDRDGPPFDPDSTGELGLAGLVAVLEELGAEVTTELPVDEPVEADSVLLVRDQLSDTERDGLRQLAEAGTTVVVADPGSPLSPGEVGSVSEGGLVLDCDLEALQGAQRLSARVELLLPPQDAVACYRSGSGAWLVARQVGDGAVVGLGGAIPFVNTELDQGDHAAMAAGLLAPTGTERVAVVVGATPGGGSQGLADLVAPGVKAALWQVGIALVVVALWRGRRHGRPVEEPAPVEVEGRALVEADAGLRQRAGAAAATADRIVASARTDLARLVGLDSSASPEVVAGAVAARTGIDERRLLAALSPVSSAPGRSGRLAGPAGALDDAGLLEVARTIGGIREEVQRALV